jgi:vault protein inter-alpha-trypsin-like protein/VWA domain-containing protein
MHRSLTLERILSRFAFLLLAAPAFANDGVVLAPEAGRLDALDADGNVAGPCPLRHTDVSVEISGPFARTTVVQLFQNPFPDVIEAVYTFPLSSRAAVDRMRLILGDRVVEGEVHERSAARATYEAARASGHVASLLEQERPNVFTQSVANVEPGAEVRVEISSVEILEPKNGEWSYVFPMVVGPRYVPGSPPAAAAPLPAGCESRRGAVLLAPATLALGESGDVSTLGTLQSGKLAALLASAAPIRARSEHAALWQRFEAAYPDGSRETGELWTDGFGEIGGRWFRFDPSAVRGMGTGFAPDTDRVPDASRITPQPVRPGVRAGHDVSLALTLDTGGPAIVGLRSALHEIVETDSPAPSGARSRATIELRQKNEIPNRDFVLEWKEDAPDIEDAILTHVDARGGFLTLMLQPPARVEASETLPRELVFVLDTSGSMSGRPIEKAKAVIAKAIDGLRAGDTFDLITFSGDTHVLWPEPRPATAQNRAEAQAFLAERRGDGGTEMMQAIEAALAPSARTRGDSAKPAPMRIACFLTDGYVGNDLEIVDAVKRWSGTTRVFSFGIGNSVNRFLLDGMARAGRGEVETVLLDDDADAKVARFVRRIETPVLADVQVEWSPNLEVSDALPAHVPDLFDVQPIVVHARFRSPRTGTITVRGTTAAGPWSRTLPVELPAAEPAHDAIATCWARARVDSILDRDLAALQRGQVPDDAKKEIVALGETFGILTPLTSFVAVEKMTITVGGSPRLVAVPVEMPDGVSYEGVFGKDAERLVRSAATGSGGFALAGKLAAPAQVEGLEEVLLCKDGDRGEDEDDRRPAASVPSGGFPALAVRERAAVSIADLAASGKRSDALDRARRLVERHPDFAAGKALRDALADASLGDDALRTRIAEARAAASDAIASAVRRAKLEQRLDARLLAIVGRLDGPVPAGVTIVDGGVLVTVAVTRLDVSTIAKLERAGLVVRSTAKTANLAIGIVPLGKLEDLALLDDVRRVDPTQLR